MVSTTAELPPANAKEQFNAAMHSVTDVEEKADSIPCETEDLMAQGTLACNEVTRVFV